MPLDATESPKTASRERTRPRAWRRVQDVLFVYVGTIVGTSFEGSKKRVMELSITL
jgi:hypothetical protein